jgi:hypothetical protein
MVLAFLLAVADPAADAAALALRKIKMFEAY